MEEHTEEKQQSVVDHPEGQIESSQPTAKPVAKSGEKLVFGQKKLFIVVSVVVVVLLVGSLLVTVFNTDSGAGENPTETVTGTPDNSLSALVGGKVGYIRSASILVEEVTNSNVSEFGTVDLDVFTPQKTSWSIDGRLLAHLLVDEGSGQSEIRVVNVSDGKVLDVFNTQAPNPIYDFTWIPGSSDIVISYKEAQSDSYALSRVSVLGFAAAQKLLDWVRPITGVQVASGGFVYFLDEDNELWRGALGSERFLPVLQGVQSFTLSPDGFKIAYERVFDGEIWISNEDGRNQKQVTFTSDVRQEIYGKGGRSDPHWSPDGSKLFFTESAANYKGVGFVNEDGTGLRSLEADSLSPQITYDQVLTRDIQPLNWVNSDLVLVVGEVGNSSDFTDNLYVLSLIDGSYQELIEGVVAPVWSRLN